uniref:Alpha 1,4-glycosyltransferase domain-containing protein n=1 Tax=Anopheles epiroticus TaxID=199890 RepID=A0A182PCN3_9DIPT
MSFWLQPKRYKRRIVSVLLLLLFGAIYVLYNFVPEPPIHNCFQVVHIPGEDSWDGEKLLDDVQQSEPQPSDDGRNIFFHETSCTRDGVIRLNPRQACAIESAARLNPGWKVYVLFAAPVGFRNRSDQPILEALLEYRNVHLRYVNLTTYANETPLEEWMESGEIFRSLYMNSHLSDVMRYLTLYKYGGTYLDLDVIVQRPFETMEPNYAGAESVRWVAAGVMNFEPKGHGHELAEMCVRDLLANFNGKDWGNNGPGVVTRVLQKYCHTRSTVHMTRERCRHFTVYPISAFYAIGYEDYKQFFEEQYLEQALVTLNQSIVVHVWNKFSRNHPVRVGSRVAYGVLAERHCPKVYRNIYFLETSAPFKTRITIEPRQACAIESAARANPLKKIVVLLVSWHPITDPQEVRFPDLSTLAHQQNIRFRWLDLEQFAKGTPVEEVIRSDKLYKRSNGAEYLSEILRLVLLYKYGGIYLDLDVVSLKTLDFFNPNFFGAETERLLGTSVIGLERNGFGELFAERCLNNFKYFDEQTIVRNGSFLLTYQVVQTCEKLTLEEIVTGGCQGMLKVYERSIFHPFDGSNVGIMFDADRLEEAKARIAKAMTVHMLHRTSKEMGFDGESTGYQLIAKTFCPNVYEGNSDKF